MMRLSVIVALYNNRVFIRDCIDSLYQQSLSDDEFEVIVVDDGSTDGGGDWVEQHYSNHPNLRVVRHEVNKGLGEARNTGLREAKGDYVHFIDADDFILSGAYRYFIDNILPLDSDIFFISYVKDGLLGNHFENGDVSFTGRIGDFLHRNGMSVLVWRKIFRRAFFERNTLHWPSISYGEDTVITWDAFRYEGTITEWKAKVYSYRTNDSGIVRQRTIQGVKKSIEDFIVVNLKQRDLSPYYASYPNVRMNFTDKYCILFNRILCTPHSYQELKRLFSRCAEIGIEHLAIRKEIRLMNFFYHHPILYIIFYPLIVKLYFIRNPHLEKDCDFLTKRLRPHVPQ